MRTRNVVVLLLVGVLLASCAPAFAMLQSAMYSAPFATPPRSDSNIVTVAYNVSARATPSPAAGGTGSGSTGTVLTMAFRLSAMSPLEILRTWNSLSSHQEAEFLRRIVGQSVTGRCKVQEISKERVAKVSCGEAMMESIYLELPTDASAVKKDQSVRFDGTVISVSPGNTRTLYIGNVKLSS